MAPSFDPTLLRIEDPCPDCRGVGRYYYGSTATWRGGVGGAAMTLDLCDRCWGSGDPRHPFQNLRDLERRAARVAVGNTVRGLVASVARFQRTDGPVWLDTLAALDKLAAKVTSRTPAIAGRARFAESLAAMLREGLRGGREELQAPPASDALESLCNAFPDGTSRGDILRRVAAALESTGTLRMVVRALTATSVAEAPSEAP